jgi:protein phosphatase
VEKITTLLPRTFSMGAAGMDAGHADLLNELFSRVHRALRLLGGSYDECRGMETTLSLCWFSPGRMHFGHIGDSRIYLLPGDGGALRRLTHDDTHVDWLFRTGKINEREARSHPGRHVLQRALGGGNQFVEPQVGSVAHAPGDLFLICSDGLTDGLHERALEDHLRLPWGEAVEGASITARLISEALASGSRDNVTAVAIRMESA